MADNTILLKAGFDLAKLDEEIGKFSRRVTRGLNSALKGYDLGKAIGVDKTLKFEIGFNKAALKRNFNDALDSLKQVKVPLVLSFTKAKQQIKDFQDGLRPLEIGVKAVAAPTTPTLTGRTSTFSAGESGVASAQNSLTSLKAALQAGGASLVEIEKKTQGFDRAILQASVRLQQLSEQEKEGKLSADSLSKAYVKVEDTLDRLNKTIAKTNPTHITDQLQAQKVDNFFKNFAFSLGAIGYGMQNLGRHLTGVVQQMVNLVQVSAQATAPIQRISNLLAVDKNIDPLQLKSIVKEIRGIADLPGASLEKVADAFRILRTLNQPIKETIQLVEGLTKAAALSGVGAEGVAHLAQQLRQFSASKQLRELDIKAITEQGGTPVTEILKKSFGEVSAVALEKAGPTAVIKALTEGLKDLQAPAVTTEDQLNRIKNSLIDLALVLDKLLAPGLEKLHKLLKETITPTIQAMGDAFDGLSGSTKDTLSSLALIIPGVVGGLGILLSILGPLAIGIAVVSKVTEGYGRALSKLTGLTGAGLESFSLLGTASAGVSGLFVELDVITVRLLGNFKNFKTGLGLLLEVTSGLFSKLVLIIKAIAVGTPEIYGFAAATGGLAGSLGGVFGGILKILGLTNPIGILINLIIAFATNFGGFRDKVVAGAGDLVDSFKRLFAVFTTFFNSPVGKFVFGLGQFIGDILASVTGLAGDLIGIILSALGAVVDFITDIIAAFSEGRFITGIQRAFEALATVIIHLFGVLVDVVKSVVVALINLVGPTMERLGLLSKGFTKEAAEAVAGFGASLTDVNYQLKDGTYQLRTTNKEVDNNTTALKTAEQAAKDYAEALQAVGTAAKTAFDELLKLDIQQSKKASKGVIDTIKFDMENVVKAYTESVKHLFTDDEINTATQTAFNKLQSLFNKGSKEFAQKTADGLFEAFNGLRSNELIKSVRSTTSGPLGTISDLVTTILDTDNLDTANAGLAKLGKTIYNFIQLGSVNAKQGQDLLILKTLLENTVKSVVTDTVDAGRELYQSTEKLREQINTAAKSQYDANAIARANQESRAEIGEIDAQIATKRAAISALEADVEKSLLTNTGARKKRLTLELEILKLEKDIKLSKIGKDRAKLDPNNTFGLSENTSQSNAVETEFNQKSADLTSTLEREGQKDATSITAKRIGRVTDAAKTAADALQPLNAQIDKLVGFLILDGKTPELVDTLNVILDKSQKITANLPDVGRFFESLKGDNFGVILKAFQNLQAAPAKAELQGQLVGLRNSIQAILFDDVNFNEQGDITGGTDLLAKVFGLNDIPKTRESLINKIQALDFPSILRATTEIGRSGLDSIEREELEGLVIQAKKVQAEVTTIELEASNSILKRLDDSILAIQKARLESQIKENDAQLAAIEADNSTRVIKLNLDVKRKLEVDNLKHLFKIEDYQLIFAAREKLRATADANEQKRILKDLEDERVRLRLESETKIKAITGDKTPLTPVTVPKGLPGAEEINGTGGTPITPPKSKGLFGDIKANLGDLSALDTFSGKVSKVAKALNETTAAARASRDELTGLVNYVASGDFTLDTLIATLNGTATAMDLFASVGLAAFTASIQFLGDTLISFLEGGELTSFGEFLGTILMKIGEQLISLAGAVVAYAAITAFFEAGGGIAGLIAAATAAAQAVPLALLGVGAGALLILAGRALGGKGSKSPTKTANTNVANTANTAAGATGTGFDPNKDPKTIYQKALQTTILLDIRSDNSQIIKVVEKHVNQNGRLTRLIGNRALGFGY